MLYEYKCFDCRKVIEKIQHPTEVGNHPCECGGTLKRYIHTMPNLSPQCFVSQKIIDIEDLQEKSYAEIKQKERETGKVFMSVEEHQKEVKKNRDAIEKRENETISREFTELAMKKFANAGILEA